LPGGLGRDFARNGGGTLAQALEFVKMNSWTGFRTCGYALYCFQLRFVIVMKPTELSPLLEPLLGHIVIVDLVSSYVCLGTFVAADAQFLELHDADLHDFRDSTATREVYVHDSVRLGIRRNRARVLIRRAEIVAVTKFEDIATF
jgi:hypothetical protein